MLLRIEDRCLALLSHKVEPYQLVREAKKENIYFPMFYNVIVKASFDIVHVFFGISNVLIERFWGRLLDYKCLF